MEIRIIKKPISRVKLKEIAKERFGYMVKGVVDIRLGIMALGGELHIDEAVQLNELCQSKSDELWGINLYPDKVDADFIEFDSMVNIKPNLGNRTRGIDDPKVKEIIKKIVKKLISD